MTATLRVATVNLAKGELRWDERAALLLEQVAALDPDIVGFQEGDLRIDQGNWLARRLNELLGYDLPGDLSYGSHAGPQYRMYHMANPRDLVALEALGILTRLPVVAHEGFDYLFRNRVAHRIRVSVGGGLLMDFYNTHLHHEQDAAGNDVRREQAERLVRWIDSDGWDVPKVLVGDFNSPPGTRPIRLIKERFASAYEVIHGNEPDITIPTPLFPLDKWPANWPKGVAVDYIFVSRSLRVTDARVVLDRPSSADSTLYPTDHFALAATIELS